MSDSNTVLITKYSFGDDPNDPDAGEKIQTSDTVASMGSKTLPAGNGLTGGECNWIEWSPMQKEQLNLTVYWGLDNKMYMAKNGPGFENGMLQFADNGTGVDADGVLEYCPQGHADCPNPNTFAFSGDLMQDTAGAKLIEIGGSTANGWVRLYARTGTGAPPWSKTDFSPYGTHALWFGDDVPFCHKTDIKGDCMVGESTDYMTLDVTLSGNIYNWPDFPPTEYDYSSYTVTSGSQATCDGLASGGGGECKNAISAELVFEDGTVLLPYPSGHLVTSECSECPSLDSITPVVKEKCNGCLELDLGNGTETFTYGTLFGQEDLCDNSSSHGKEVTVRTNSEPSEPSLFHLYSKCHWHHSHETLPDHESNLYISTDAHPGNNNTTPPTNVTNNYKYLYSRRDVRVVPNHPPAWYEICYKYMGTVESVLHGETGAIYIKDGSPKATKGSKVSEVSFLDNFLNSTKFAFQEATCCEQTT